jgi:hypothetical protein
MRVSQELIAIVAVGVVVIGSHWRLDDDIDSLRDRVTRLEAVSQTRITGRITASTGVALSGARVVASSPDPDSGTTGPDQTCALLESGQIKCWGGNYIGYARTDNTGRYMLDGLRPGVYTLTFASPQGSVTKEQDIPAGITIIDAEL